MRQKELITEKKLIELGFSEVNLSVHYTKNAKAWIKDGFWLDLNTYSNKYSFTTKERGGLLFSKEIKTINELIESIKWLSKNPSTKKIHLRQIKAFS